MFEGLNVKKVCNMKKEIIRFFKMWTLPLGMFAGVGIYLMFHYIPLLSPLKVLAKGAEDFILPVAQPRQLDDGRGHCRLHGRCRRDAGLIRLVFVRRMKK